MFSVEKGDSLADQGQSDRAEAGGSHSRRGVQDSNLALQGLSAGTDEAVSILDNEAFTARHFPLPNYAVEGSHVFHWSLFDWQTLGKKIISPEFYCGGHRWRILLFPNGSGHALNEFVSIYLSHADPNGAAEGWHICAQFALVMSNPHDPTRFVIRQACHRFTAYEPDWGFPRFQGIQKIAQSPDGKKRSIVQDGTSVISVFIRAVKDSTGVLWHSTVDYDSKKETGFVGIINQGATGYMTSLLPWLFSITYLVKAVYKVPTLNQTPAKSTPLALQRLFHLLQTSPRAVSTEELTKSFGWRDLDSFMMHDVVEFHRVLSGQLERMTKGTRAEGVMAELFAGKLESYIKCLDVDYEASRVEDFYDIELRVDGIKNLRDSFRDYVAVDNLEGDNQHLTEGFGPQDATKGVIFRSFPKVLHLELRRYRYDVQRDRMTKIGDRFEYPFEIDLEEFLDESVERTKRSWLYRLHAVIVHSGNSYGGKYFSFIKHRPDTRWLKYNNEHVTPATDREVLEDNYGGEPPAADGVSPTPGKESGVSTSAYMLAYVRESAYDQVFAPITEHDKPAHMIQRFREERLAQEAKKREYEVHHPSPTVKVVSDLSFEVHQGFDLATFEDENKPVSELATFELRSAETYLAFKARVAQHFLLAEEQIRLWVVVNRQNNTVRPETVIPENNPTLTVEQVRNKVAARQDDLRLYLDVTQAARGKVPFAEVNQNSIMILLKYFDVHKQALTGECKVYVNRRSRVGDLSIILTKRMGWVPTTPLKFYEEVKPGVIEILELRTTFAQNESADGDIICFQAEITDKEAHDLESRGMHSNPMQFYDFIQNCVLILFRPSEEKDGEEFVLTLQKKMSYEDLSQEVGGYLNHDPLMLRFSIADGQCKPQRPITGSLKPSLSEIVQWTYVNGQSSVLFYERLDVSVLELETKRALRVVWVGLHNQEEQALSFLLRRTTMISEVVELIAKKVTLPSRNIQIFSITKSGRHQKEHSALETIGNLPDVDFYAEEIPIDETTAVESDKIINAFHYTRYPSATYGVPFKLVIRPAEQFAVTKRRIRERLEISARDISDYGFTLLRPRGSKWLTKIEDGDVLYDYEFQSDDALGLDHPWRN